MIDLLVLEAEDNWIWHFAWVLTAILIGVAILVTSSLKAPDGLKHLPKYEVVTKPTAENQFTTAEALLQYAYHKHRHEPFVIGGRWRRWDTVILPPHVFDEIKSLPEDELSFYGALDTRFLHDFTTIKVPEEGGDVPMLKALAIDLPRHLKNYLDDIADEVDYAFKTVLLECDKEWVEVYPMKVLPRILALVSGRILVCLPLSRDPDFLQLKLDFFKNSFIAMALLGMIPRAVRPAVAFFLPYAWRLHAAHRTMQRIMEPIAKQRKLDDMEGKDTPSDLLSWVINSAPPHLKYNVRYQAHAQLITNVASIQSLYVASSHAWFDIAAHQECIQPLRDEWNEILSHGKISFEGISQAKKFDSFIKESARCNPSQLTATEYVLRRELLLNDGTLLPKGTYLGTASSQLGRDPSLWETPEHFDGFRYEKLRNQPGNEGKYQFTSTGLDQLSFGYGRHPCPGRFFAGHTLKIMLAKLIERYDVRLADGKRPKNVENWIALRPDDRVPVLMRKRGG